MSPDGDLLLTDQPITAGLFVARKNLATFCATPSQCPHYSFTKPVEVETLRLASEFGFTFRVVHPPGLQSYPELLDRPIIRIMMGGSISLLLVPTKLHPDDVVALLNADEGLGILVSHSIALPRSHASTHAVEILKRSAQMSRRFC